MRKECQTVQEILTNKQWGTEGLQANGLPSWVSNHLSQCEACHDFVIHYPALTTTLQTELDKAIASLPGPDFSFLNNPAVTETEQSAPERFMILRLLPWAAALFVFLLGALLSYSGFKSATPQTLVTEDSKLFINRLYASALTHSSLSGSIPEDETDADAILPDEWFEVTDQEADPTFSSPENSTIFDRNYSGSM